MIAQNIQGINNATNTKGVVLENIHTPPTPPRRATEIPREGGIQKKAISRGMEVTYRGFFQGV